MSKNPLTKKRIVIPVVILLVLVAAVIVVGRTGGDDGELNVFQRVARQTLSGVSRIGAGFAGFFDFATKQSLQAELDEVNMELAETKTALQVAESYAAENERLKELLNYRDTLAPTWNTEAACVIGRDIDNWYERLLIDKGSADGIVEGLAVVNQDGLIGRTTNVTETTCEVLLIIDAMGSLGGVLRDTRTQGVLEGIGGGKGLLTMKNLPYSANIQLNEIVVTSGSGGVFPAGLLVGTVIKVETSLDGLSKHAVVEPYCDFDHIEEVLVLTGKAAPSGEGGNTDEGGENSDGGDGATDTPETPDTTDAPSAEEAG